MENTDLGIGVIELMKYLGDGRVLDDMHNRLAEVLAAVKHCHKKGKVVVTLEVKPTDDLEMQRVEIHGSVTYKVPLPNRGHDLLYVDESLGLHKRDPRQRRLPANTIEMREDLDGQSRAAGER